jgi:hypothetical protein
MLFNSDSNEKGLVLSFSVSIMLRGCNEATVAQLAEQLICNQRVGGSIPFGGSRERFPSGQREQTVNLPAKPSEVRILPSPPVKKLFCRFYCKCSEVKTEELLKSKMNFMVFQFPPGFWNAGVAQW